jgi:hypothetical protein
MYLQQTRILHAQYSNVAACGALHVLRLTLAYDCQECGPPFDKPATCCNIPSDNRFILTTFDGSAQSSCGNCNSFQYYTADRQRWGVNSCGQALNVCNGANKCVTAHICDVGPGDWVEKRDGVVILDANKALCQTLFGSDQCGMGNIVTVNGGGAPPSPAPPGPTPPGPSPIGGNQQWYGPSSTTKQTILFTGNVKKCVDLGLPGSDTTNGNHIQLWDCNNG